MANGSGRRVRVMAVASVGGHWEQMMQLREALEPHGVRFVTTEPDLLKKAGVVEGAILPDCNLDQPWRSFKCMVRAFLLVWRTRPAVILSTGAAPGFFCLLAGRTIGARTVWIDSIANVERLSKSGAMAKWVAHERLTQWEHLALPGGPQYAGSVL